MFVWMSRSPAAPRFEFRSEHVWTLTFLSGCLAFVHADHTVLSGCLAFVHACCLPHSAKQNGLRYVPFLFRRES